MKTLNKFIFLSLFLVAFTSCQKEISEITQAPQNEVLKANSNAATLVHRTTTKDGSKDNIIDNASCISVQLPVTVEVQGIEIILNSEEDFEVIETIFDEFNDDIDHLDFIFPIVITLSDFTEITIDNFDELENIITECVGENEVDDDIECIDFVYPITLSIFDAANELAETIIVENDEQFYRFTNEIEEHHVVQINFPITVELYDGTHQTITNMDELEIAMEEADGKCDEDDDNDFDDDDCIDCTDTRITNLLVSCSWTVDKIKVDGVENTEQYTNFVFTFLENGDVMAESGGNEIVGVWTINHTDNGSIIVKLNFENFDDFSFNWVLYEIKEDNELDLRFEENRLAFEKTCIEDKLELIAVLNEGNWLVANFMDKGENYTSDYNDFTLNFNEDFTITATKGEDVVNGTWAVIYDSGMIKLELDFGDAIPFDKLNEDWLTVTITNTRVEVNNLDDSGNEESKLVFERM